MYIYIDIDEYAIYIYGARCTFLAPPHPPPPWYGPPQTPQY